jgi:transposase
MEPDEVVRGLLRTCKMLVNARDAKHVPGRKTDVTDAQWLRACTSMGCCEPAFAPRRRIAALRNYLCQRERLLDYADADEPAIR